MLFTQETNQKNGIEELEDRQNPKKTKCLKPCRRKKTSLSFFKFDEKLAMFLRNLFIGMSKTGRYIASERPVSVQRG